MDAFFRFEVRASLSSDLCPPSHSPFPGGGRLWLRVRSACPSRSGTGTPPPGQEWNPSGLSQGHSSFQRQSDTLAPQLHFGSLLWGHLTFRFFLTSQSQSLAGVGKLCNCTEPQFSYWKNGDSGSSYIVEVCSESSLLLRSMNTEPSKGHCCAHWFCVGSVSISKRERGREREGKQANEQAGCAYHENGVTVDNCLVCDIGYHLGPSETLMSIRIIWDLI